MRRRRVISKSKIYGFSPYVDQIDAINQIMKQTGEKTESVLLRKLVDEALVARLKKSQALPLIEEPEDEGGGTLQEIESLLIRLTQQGEVSLRMQDVCLALLQDALAEAHATRRLTWESMVMPNLREQGVAAKDAESRFILQLDRAKEYAYGLAEQFTKTQETS